MVRDQQTQGIALVCDQDGRLLEVLYDGLGVTADVQYGRPFTQLVDVSGLGKALNSLRFGLTDGDLCSVILIDV